MSSIRPVNLGAQFTVLFFSMENLFAGPGPVNVFFFFSAVSVFRSISVQYCDIGE